MERMKKVISKIPSWLIMLLLFGLFYYTGWHKDLISQVQRVFLMTGVLDADVPSEVNQEVNNAVKAGEGFAIRKLETAQTEMFEQFHGKVVFLNLWASWCPPCKAEMPSIQDLYEDMQDEDIEFVMLSLDQDIAKAKDFITANEYTFPVYLPLENLPEEFRSRTIPTSYIISPGGMIVFSHSGIANYNSDEMKNFLRELVG